MGAAVDVSVLIPVLNEEDHLREAAMAMLAQEFSGTIELLFIDGGSRDASRAILSDLAARDPRVRLLENPARRTPHALNIGLRAARGEFIARMDAHTMYPPRYLAAGVARLERGDVAWVSGPQLAAGTDPGSRRVARAMSTALGVGGARFRRDLRHEVDVDTTFTGMWRRATLEEHGGWDEEWINDQDAELAARIRARGGRIICIPEMAANYVPRNSLPRLARQYLTYGTYRVKTARRHPDSMRRSHLLPPGLVLAAAAAAAGPSRHVRRVARTGVAAYALLLGVTSARAALDEDAREAATLPAVWATMHLSYGIGFWRGCFRHGLPVAAAARLLRV
jgi:glycosyltransferase involved in cell wall biosynthesis